MQSYLSNRKQRTKINSEFSPWEEILYRLPQGSILGPLLFNIFLCDLLFIMNDVDFATYADDNTPFFVDNNLDEVIFKLQGASKTIFPWFTANQMKANTDKGHFICSCNLKTSIQTCQVFWIHTGEIRRCDLAKKNAPHHGWRAKKILDPKTSTTTILVYKEPTLTKLQNNIITNPKENNSMDFNKRKLIVNAFFQRNLTTARWFGYAIIEVIITKQIGYPSKG